MTTTVTVTGLQDSPYSAGTALAKRQIKALGAQVTLASTGRVTVVTSAGERRVYVLKLDQQLVDDSRMGYPGADVQARLSAADSPLSRALRDLQADVGTT